MKIKINNLKVKTIIGVYEHEKKREQEIIINAVIYTDFYNGSSDNIKETLDYDEICANLKKVVSSSRFNLLEKLAHQLLEEIMQDKRINKVKVEVAKPSCVEGAESINIVVSSD